MIAQHSKIGPESDAVLRGLFELYLHDMAAWFEFDAGTAYAAASIWADGSEVYLTTLGDAPVGFALIGPSAESFGSGDVHDVHEFFVLNEFRRSGIGQAMAASVWNQHPGEWLVRVLEANAVALSFWRATIASYTGGAYSELHRDFNGRPWRFFRFRAASS